jgi:hypothetical protein
MRRLIYVLILASSLFFPLGGVKAQGPDQGRPPGAEFEIALKSRRFVPSPGVAALQGPAPRHVLIQFKHIPDEAEREALARAGVRLLAYVPHKTWFASISPGSDLAGQALADMRWLGDILPQDRLHRRLREGRIGAWASRPGGRVGLNVFFFADVSRSQARQIVSGLGGYVRQEFAGFNLLVVDLPQEALASLADADEVQWIEEVPPPVEAHNDGSRARTRVDMAHAAPYDLDGSGVDLGIWDEGKVGRHVDFAGRLTIVDTHASAYNHPTHVAGIMAGSGTHSGSWLGTPFEWMGMAPGAHIYSYYWDNRINELNGAINTYGIELAQNSWGYIINSSNCSFYGDYYSESAQYDQIVTGLYGRRINVVFSCGNERNDGDCGMSSTPPYLNYANITPPATAKNVIAVGATNSDDDSMTTFSSWGPVDDGRTKPDVVAPGCEATGEGHIHSTLPGNSYGGSGWCGTSMAAPTVSGISGLLIQQYRDVYGNDPLPGTIKAVLVHSAADLDDGTSYYNPGPDYASGYGRVDAPAAADLIRARDLRVGSVANGETDNYQINVPPGTSALTVTVAWDDYPATPNANPALVNDLDLWLTDTLSISHNAWILNPASPADDATTGWDDRNNVEQVYVSSPVSGTWTINVSGYAVPYGPQNYTLVTEFFSNTPQINDIIPFCGEEGDAVTIAGSAFGKTQGSGTVSFNGTLATVTSWNATRIETTIPTGATSGPATVTTTEGGSNGFDFPVGPCDIKYLPIVLKNGLPTQAYEPNNTLKEPYGPLASGATYGEYISADNDYDAYYFDITTTDDIQVSLTNIPAGADYELELYDASYNRVAGSYNIWNNNEYISYSPLSTGRYFVVVYPDYGYSSSYSYYLRVAFDGMTLW